MMSNSFGSAHLVLTLSLSGLFYFYQQRDAGRMEDVTSMTLIHLLVYLHRGLVRARFVDLFLQVRFGSRDA